jgi:hypothetical protein
MLTTSKFRLLSVTDHGDRAIAHLRPVTPRSKYDPEGSDENRAFWEATPSGEIEVPIDWLPEQARAIGATCLVDVIPNEAAPGGETPWTIGECSISAWGFSLALHPHKLPGRVHLGITNPRAVLLLMPELVASKRAMIEARLADPSCVEIPRADWRVIFR